MSTKKSVIKKSDILAVPPAWTAGNGWISDRSLMERAPYVAEYYMLRAVEMIDAAFGEGYAREHPELIAGFMITAASDVNANETIKEGLLAS